MTAFHRDIAVGIGLIGLAIGAVLGVRHLEGWASRYPVLMAGALLVSALLLIGFSVHRMRTPGGVDAGESSGSNAGTGSEPRTREVLPVVVASVALAATAPWLGFYPATFLYLAGLFAWRSALGPVAAILTGAALTVGLYVVFKLFLAVPTPTGLVGVMLQG